MPFPNVTVDTRDVECVEIYVPKKLEHLSELFNYLRSRLGAATSNNPDGVTFDGFSLYEVDGAFIGGRMYQERTLVVRIFFARASADKEAIQKRILAIGRDIAGAVALDEEELWIAHYPQGVVVFRPEK